MKKNLINIVQVSSLCLVFIFLLSGTLISKGLGKISCIVMCSLLFFPITNMIFVVRYNDKKRIPAIIVSYFAYVLTILTCNNLLGITGEYVIVGLVIATVLSIIFFMICKIYKINRVL